MDEKLQPRDCRFCRSKNVLVVQVDEQLDGDYFAVECQCCWAEGPHSVTKEMAIRFWGIKEPEFITQPETIDTSHLPTGSNTNG